MKLFTQAVVLALVLGLAGVAEAKKQKDNSGIKGKIVSVSPTAITIQHKEKGSAPEQLTIKIDANTTIEVNGVSSKFSGLQAGQHVRVQGGTDGPATDIQATSGKSGGHHHRAV